MFINGLYYFSFIDIIFKINQILIYNFKSQSFLILFLIFHIFNNKFKI